MELDLRKRKFLFFFVLMFAFLYLSFTYNMFGAAEQCFFLGHQRDSEDLVLGKIIADRVGKTNKLSNLGRSFMEGTKGIVFQSYNFIEEKEPINNIRIADFSDNNWNKGGRKSDKSFLIESKFYDLVRKGTGYQLLVGDQKRYIKEVKRVGEYAEVHYYGEKLPESGRSFSVNFDAFDTKDFRHVAYTSQYGFQGMWFSLLYNKFGISFRGLQKINTIILSVTIILLTLLFAKVFSKQLAFLFFITIFLSPWVVSFARNLYWVEFTWFVPAVFCYFMWLKKNFDTRIFLLALFCSSVFIKCLCGYEYLSSILLFAAAPFVYELLTSTTKEQFQEAFKWLVAIGLVGVLGFMAALLFHASLRTGGDVIEGLKIIWETDVKRRTYGDPALFNPAYKDSLTASAWQVVMTYIGSWRTDIILGIPGNWFVPIVCLALLTIFGELSFNHPEARKQFYLLITFALPALSWYILGKSHSYVHTHMNFVLWYFGFVAVTFYVIITGLARLAKPYINRT